MAERNHVVARATSSESLSTTTHHVAKLPPEEPDAGNLHVRVCEGASGQPLALLGDGVKWKPMPNEKSYFVHAVAFGDLVRLTLPVARSH